MLVGTHGCMLHDPCLVPWRVARRRARAAACTCRMPVYSGAHACTAGCPERTISRGGPVYARNSLLLLLLLCGRSLARFEPWLVTWSRDSQ